jgi:plasmid stabilization system protein ParE
MKLIVSPRAFRDTEQIKDYLRERSPQAALRIANAIDKTIDRIVAFPDSGQDQTETGVKRVVERRYGHLIFYRYSDDLKLIEIITIRHGRRRPIFENR